jgi:uncharacterized protein
MPVSAANTLSQAASSYLRSAAHQPIHWHEWGQEAFAAAQRENKPILLDIGAVWCHWCHVMDRESYENPETARVINENFIAVKVDRDERPDVDSRYQAAVQAISGQGGWPLTVFLTPEGKPFFGGTYFPPADQWGRPGFPRVLQAIAAAYRDKHGEVQESAGAVMAAIAQSETFVGREGHISPRIAERMVESALQGFDAQYGGFGHAPKFPHPSALDLVMDRYARTGDERLRNLIVTTLTRMAQGGVYDQLAGGFHRYSVDERWIVPHFEKMSYDNSELLKNYVHGFQVTGDEFFAHVARDIVCWMDEVLSDREHGGFYASQDADYSLDDDGDYFTWTLGEARDVLSEDELRVAAPYYDINEVGEMHHNPAKNVLYVRADLDETTKRTGLPRERVEKLLGSAKEKMLAARLRRPTPYVDKTVYVSWNALCISAYLEAARVLDLDDALHFALRSLDRILSEGCVSGADKKLALRHVIAYSDPSAAARDTRGLLDDYAFTANACLDAYEATADLSYFNFARRIADAMVERFFDATGGGFFDTPASFTGNGDNPLGALVARRKPFQDAPTPAGNPAATLALLRLHEYTNHVGYREKAEQTLELFAGVAEQFGIFAATYGIAVVRATQPHVQAIVIGPHENAATNALYHAAVTPYAINKTALHLTPNEAVAPNLPPALAETIAQQPALKDEKPFALLCTGTSCQPPAYEAESLNNALNAAIRG